MRLLCCSSRPCWSGHRTALNLCAAPILYLRLAARVPEGSGGSRPAPPQLPLNHLYNPNKWLHKSGCFTHWLFPLGTTDGKWAHSDLIPWPSLILWLNGERQVRIAGLIELEMFFCMNFIRVVVVVEGNVKKNMVQIPPDPFSDDYTSRCCKVSIKPWVCIRRTCSL